MIKNLKKKYLIYLLIIILTISVFYPIAIGDDIRNTAESINLEKQIFIYSDIYHSSKLSYYEKYSQIDYSNNNVRSQDIQKSEISTTKIITGGPMDSAWPIKCHDISHTSRSPYSTADNPGIEKWRYSTDGGIEDSPIIDSDGTIYFGGNYGGLPWYLFAVNPNGTEKWKFKTNYLIMGSSPAIAEDGTIYIGSWDGGLYAINPNGTQKWRFSSAAQVASSPAIEEDGTIYFGIMGPGDIGRIYAVNPNGTEKWHYDADWNIVSDPAIGNDGTVYIGSLDSYLYALYPNGTLKWRFKTGNRIYGSPSIADDGTIYIGSSWDSYLYAVYPNGTIKWKYGGAGTPNNPSIGIDGTIYAGYLYHLVALNPDGSLKWSFYVGDDRWIGTSAPAISADGTIYFGICTGDDEGGEIVAVNPDGTEKWRKWLARYRIKSSPSIAEDGTVYIGSSYDMGGGYLHAFGTQESNNLPETPIISGPANGKAGIEYSYNFVSVDPDNNPVSFYIDWGDGTNSGWTREYASGETAKIKHTWNEQGSYTIQAKAKDTFSGESGWFYFDVTMPRNRASYYSSFFINFLERFPFFQKIIYLIYLQ